MFSLFCFMDETLNLFRRGIDIDNINISRRPKGIPNHSAAVGYPFITVLSVGAGGGVSVQFFDNFLRRVS